MSTNVIDHDKPTIFSQLGGGYMLVAGYMLYVGSILAELYILVILLLKSKIRKFVAQPLAVARHLACSF